MTNNINRVYHRDGGYPPLLERRPTYAEVDLTALEMNYSAIRRRLPETGIIAIVKADAYGHGLIPIAKAFERFGADCIGVGFLEEGIALREAGISAPVLSLGGVAGFQIDYFLEYDLELTASSLSILQEIHRRARRMNRIAKVHLKIDTGLNRIGVNYKRALPFLETSASLPGIEVKGIYSHLASAGSDPEFTNLQFQRLREFQKPAQRIFGREIPFHLLNSAGIITFPEGALQLVRPGLVLYGMVNDIEYRKIIKLFPVLSLKSEAVFIKRVPAGEGVSYGSTYTVPKETTIVTVPIGYGDGYPQRLSNKGFALIGGKKFPIAGKVCMDQIMLDVGDNYVRIGEEVVLIGKQGDAQITVEDICAQIEAIPYEVTIGITSRVPRLYLGEKGGIDF
jgi:alanine racemase